MLMLANTQVELWKNFLEAGQISSGVKLTENQEAYTVFLLQRFLRGTELMGMVLAIQYLESLLETRTKRSVLLSDTADASLILAGLYPERARRLHVSDYYFITMCKQCLEELASICFEIKRNGEAELYKEISRTAEDIAIVMCHAKNADTKSDDFRNMLHGKVLLN